MSRRDRLTPALLVAVAGLALAACEGALLAPEPSANALGHNGGTVTVPMQVDATMIWTVPGATASNCPYLIDPETGELFLAEGFGDGEATHLGHFEITELDHPTINMCSTVQDPPVPPAPADLRRDGTFEFAAADGSSISGTYSFLFLPPERGGFFTLSVEGGTERFAGASGELAFVFDESGVTQPSDPLFLSEATLEPAVFEGEITMPRP